MTDSKKLGRKGHIAILGAGPTGIHAALAAAELGCPFTLYEASPDGVAGHVRDWGHVRLFTPWEMNVSPRARRMLTEAGVIVPTGDECPTGTELIEELLQPLVELPAIAASLRTGAKVHAIGRQGLLKHEEIASPARAALPFRLLVENGAGQRIETADVVLDCTGSYSHPNHLGDGGIPAPGEHEVGDLITHRLPDFAAEGNDWAGRRVLLVGAGHSAQTAARDLAALAERRPGTEVVWLLRGTDLPADGDAEDPLPQRRELNHRAAELARGAHPAVTVQPGRVVDRLARVDRPAGGSAVEVTLRAREAATGSENPGTTLVVDRILALTGAVGDHGLYRQLQVHECYATSGPMKLAAALLGAAGGDCLDQQSHGADTLKNPEPDFFILGAKSYGRNNTFLMRVGWEQVEEVFALLEGC